MATVLRFRNRDLVNLGAVCDEITRIVDEAPEEAQDFLNTYIVYQLKHLTPGVVINVTEAFAEAEGVVASNIRWFARNSIMRNDRSVHDKIMRTFYPPVEAEVLSGN